MLRIKQFRNPWLSKNSGGNGTNYIGQLWMKLCGKLKQSERWQRASNEEDIPFRTYRRSQYSDKKEDYNLTFERHEIICEGNQEWIVCDVLLWDDREYLYVKPLSYGNGSARIMEVRRMIPEIVDNPAIVEKVDSMFWASWAFSD